jgi:hypothetical protein
MRAFLNIVEAAFADDEDETPDVSFEHLPSAKAIDALRPALVAVAQKQYDSWQQDEDGYDHEVGNGGICHLIADDMQTILSHAGFNVWTQTATDVQHVTCVVQASDGVYDVDIPYRLYEHGGGFVWTKLPDVRFEPGDVAVYCIDVDPSQISMYVEGFED